MSLTSKPTLTGARVTLRNALPEDVAARYVLGYTPEIVTMFGGDAAQIRPMTQEAAEAWVSAHRDDPHAWVIEAEGALLGGARLHNINMADRRAHLAIGLLNPKALGKGYGSEAIRLIAAHAFDEMGLHRLTLRVLDFNTRAIAAYRKVGFVEEGRERESARIGNEWHDDLIMGLLPQDLKGAA